MGIGLARESQMPDLSPVTPKTENNPTATRIAVGRFCERSLGIFFAFPGPQGADWVTLNRVDAPADDQFRPAFAWREIGGLRNELSHEWAYSVGYGRAPSF